MIQYRLGFGEVRTLPLPDDRRFYREVGAADKDDDGDADLVTTNRDRRSNVRLEWFENLGVGGRAVVRLVL